MKYLFKDIIKYFPSKFIPAIIGLITIPVITHWLSPGEYGRYTLTLTAISFASALSVSWISSSTIRYFPIYEANKEINKLYLIILRLLVASIIIVSFLFFGIYSLYKKDINDSLNLPLFIGMGAFIVLSFYEVLFGVLKAARKAGWYSFFSIWHKVASFLFGIGLVVVFNMGADGLIFGIALSGLLALPFLWKISIGKLLKNKTSIKFHEVREIIKYGIPAMIINIFTVVLSLSDRYVLNLFSNSYDVGVYSANYDIAERSIFAVNSLFLLAGTPIGFNIWENQGMAASKKYSEQITRYYFLFGFPIVIILSILAGSVVSILIAHEYYEGYKIIPLVVMGAFLAGVAQRFTIGLVFYKKTNYLMYCYLGSGLLNLFLNFLLVPQFGYFAAAVNTFISYAFLLFLTIIISRHFFVWKYPIKSSLRAMISASVAGVVVDILNNIFIFSNFSNIFLNLIILIPLFFLIYALSLFLLKEVQKNEKEIIWRSLHKLSNIISINR